MTNPRKSEICPPNFTRSVNNACLVTYIIRCPSISFLASKVTLIKNYKEGLSDNNFLGTVSSVVQGIQYCMCWQWSSLCPMKIRGQLYCWGIWWHKCLVWTESLYLYCNYVNQIKEWIPRTHFLVFFSGMSWCSPWISVFHWEHLCSSDLTAVNCRECICFLRPLKLL